MSGDLVCQEQLKQTRVNYSYCILHTLELERELGLADSLLSVGFDVSLGLLNENKNLSNEVERLERERFKWLSLGVGGGLLISLLLSIGL